MTRAKYRSYSVSLVAGLLCLAGGLRLASVPEARAQAQPDPGAQELPEPAEVEAATQTTTTSRSLFLPSPGQNLDGHLPSSSQSRIDVNEGDHFDLRPSPDGPPTLYGDADSLGGFKASPGADSAPTALYIVRPGDTLWDICLAQFGDPHNWPKVWSYNPQLKNPHWIYPGDQLHLAPATSLAAAGGGGQAGAARALASLRLGQAGAAALRLRGQGSRLPAQTVFLRDQGYIADPDEQTWGELVGARFEQQLLAEGAIVYLQMRPETPLRPGQLLTVFRPVRPPELVSGARRPPGQLIAFKGTVKVTHYDERARMARAKIIESLDIIERGAMVGPIGRRFHVVPPRTAEVDLRSVVLTSLYPHEFFAGQQVVFIDRGKNDGLKPGNRLFVVRQGDAWRDTLTTTSDMARTRIRLQTRRRGVEELVELKGERADFPQEVIAELRLIRTHPYTSLAVVSESSQELEPGDTALARRGY